VAQRENLRGCFRVGYNERQEEAFGPRSQFIRFIPVPLILGAASIDPQISSLKRLLKLPSSAADTGRPNLIMVRTVISEFAKAFSKKMDQLPLPEMVKGITYDQIEAALRLGSLKLTWLKQSLRNTLTAKHNGQRVNLWVYWPLTMWLVKQVSTPFTFPLSATQISSEIEI
jgi:hypothetical protein